MPPTRACLLLILKHRRVVVLVGLSAFGLHSIVTFAISVTDALEVNVDASDPGPVSNKSTVGANQQSLSAAVARRNPTTATAQHAVPMQ